MYSVRKIVDNESSAGDSSFSGMYHVRSIYSNDNISQCGQKSEYVNIDCGGDTGDEDVNTLIRVRDRQRELIGVLEDLVDRRSGIVKTDKENVPLQQKVTSSNTQIKGENETKGSMKLTEVVVTKLPELVVTITIPSPPPNGIGMPAPWSLLPLLDLLMLPAGGKMKLTEFHVHSTIARAFTGTQGDEWAKFLAEVNKKKSSVDKSATAFRVIMKHGDNINSDSSLVSLNTDPLRWPVEYGTGNVIRFFLRLFSNKLDTDCNVMSEFDDITHQMDKSILGSMNTQISSRKDIPVICTLNKFLIKHFN